MSAPLGGAGSASPAERRVVVPRSARYFTVGDARTARERWVVLHGYGQLAERFAAHFAPLAEGRVVVAPEALSRFYLTDDRGRHGPDSRVGATWMTREDRLVEIADYVRFLDAVCEDAFADVDGGAVPLHVLGFSQGAATACRWLEHGATSADRLVLWGGAVPPDVDLVGESSALRRTRLTLVVGAQDQYATPRVVAEQEERLRRHAVGFGSVSFDGRHALDPEAQRRVVEER